jgi:hypothetical protein
MATTGRARGRDHGRDRDKDKGRVKVTGGDGELRLDVGGDAVLILSRDGAKELLKQLVEKLVSPQDGEDAPEPDVEDGDVGGAEDDDAGEDPLAPSPLS